MTLTYYPCHEHTSPSCSISSDTFAQCHQRCDVTVGNWNKKYSKYFFQRLVHAFMKSKAPTYLCLSIYISICLLGNIVTGIILLKHYVSSHEELEITSNLTQDIFTQIKLIDFGKSKSVDSGLEFNIQNLGIDGLDQQYLSWNHTNITVSFSSNIPLL